MPAIFLSHNIEITVGDETFPLTVRRATKKEEQKLKAMLKAEQKKSEAQDAERRAYEKKMRRLNSLRSELRDNQELFALEDDADVKKELLSERRTLRADIAAIEAETESYEQPDFEKVIASFDVIPKARFEMLVEGEGKEPLLKLLDEYGSISYADLWSIINAGIAEAQKKK